MGNKEKYILFCKDRHDIPLFHEAWWLEIVTSGNWDIVLSIDKNGNILAAMPFSWSKKYFRLFSLQPVLTPYLGVIFFFPPDISKLSSIYSFENKHSNIIINEFPKQYIYQQHNFNIDFKNWYPFYFKNYIQSTRYTYILRNIKQHDLIWAGFTNTLKRQIKIAENTFTISYSENILDVFSMMKDALIKKKIKWPVKEEMLIKLDKTLAANDRRRILVAKDDEEKIVAGIYVCWDSGTAYLLALGLKKDIKESNSIKLLIWESIKAVSEHVDDYDFEGSMMTGVERLYRSFGGERIPYFVIKKYKNKIVRLLLNFINK